MGVQTNCMSLVECIRTYNNDRHWTKP